MDSISISSFHGFRYFINFDFRSTGINDQKSFRGSCIKSLTIPNIATTLPRGFLADCFYLDHLVLPPSIETLTESVLFVSKNFRYLIALPITPPKCNANVFGYRDANQNLRTIFVPDASVNAYKADSIWGWTGWHIYPLSEFQTRFPDESGEDLKYYSVI